MSFKDEMMAASGGMKPGTPPDNDDIVRLLRALGEDSRVAGPDTHSGPGEDEPEPAGGGRVSSVLWTLALLAAGIGGGVLAFKSGFDPAQLVPGDLIESAASSIASPPAARDAKAPEPLIVRAPAASGVPDAAASARPPAPQAVTVAPAPAPTPAPPIIGEGAAAPSPARAPASQTQPGPVPVEVPSLPQPSALPDPVPKVVPAPAPVPPARQEPLAVPPAPSTSVPAPSGLASPGPAQPEPASEPAGAKPAPAVKSPPAPAKPPAKAATAESTAPRDGRFVIQIGTYSVAANAVGALQLAKDKGLPAFTLDWTDRSGKDWRAVRVGPYRTETEAREALDQLPSSIKSDARVLTLR